MKYILLSALFVGSAFGATNEELERKINVLADEITQLKASQMKTSTGQQAYGLGQAASKVYFVPQGISIGGYGEITYTNKSHEDEDGNATNREPQAEALRNVIYMGYKYSDKWILNTEIEIEHVDEIYTEFLYVDYLASDALNYRFGLNLLPMGLTNELHEPIYFNSVNRPEVEKYLIPTTWREIGVGIFGSVGKTSYKAFLFNGANADSISTGISNGIRKGRKKGGSGDDSKDRTNASTGALVIRADYAFDTATSIGTSVYKGKASSANGGNNFIDMEISIAEIHGIYKENGFGTKFLATRVSFDNSKKWNEQTGATAIPEVMNGGYLEFEYDIERAKGAILTPFVRFENYNLHAEVDTDFLTKEKAYDRKNTVVGIAYKPIDRLVFKADYAYKKQGDEKGINELNLGLGFVY